MVSHIHAFVRVRPLLPREFVQSASEAVSVHEVVLARLCAKDSSAAFRRSMNDMLVQDQRIRASKDSTVLESNFDEVLGQEATQSQVFEAAQGLHCCQTVLNAVSSFDVAP